VDTQEMLKTRKKYKGLNKQLTEQKDLKSISNGTSEKKIIETAKMKLGMIL